MLSDIINKLKEGSSPSAVQVGQLSGLTLSDVREFQQLWSGVEVERRRAALALAVQLAEDDVELDFTAVFKACLADPEPTVRAIAIEGLWEDDEFRTADTLAVMLRQDPDAAVRVAAALGLARFALAAELGTLYQPSAKRVRSALFDAVTDSDELLDVRRRAIEALGPLSDPRVGELIAEAYASPESKMRASAIYAMGRSADERWLDTVLREIESDVPELRFEAARAAGEFQQPRAVVPLINLLEDGDLEVRLAAIGSLAEIGGDLARKALQQCAKSSDNAVRSAALDALAEVDLGTDPLSTSPFQRDSTRTI
jgi:HEAT repeat protein